jgi:hypothetical protein
MAAKNPAKTPIGVTQADPDGRPLRVCDWCGIIDDHPRDSGLGYNTPTPPGIAGRVLRELDQRDDIPADLKAEIEHEVTSQASYCRHLDCCREAGCPTGACDAVADEGHGDKRGKALLDVLVNDAAVQRAQYERAQLASAVDSAGPGSAAVLYPAEGQDGGGQ